MEIRLARDKQELEAHLRSFTDRLLAPHQWTAGASPSYEKLVTCGEADTRIQAWICTYATFSFVLMQSNRINLASTQRRHSCHGEPVVIVESDLTLKLQSSKMVMVPPICTYTNIIVTGSSRQGIYEDRLHLGIP